MPDYFSLAKIFIQSTNQPHQFVGLHVLRSTVTARRPKTTPTRGSAPPFALRRVCRTFIHPATPIDPFFSAYILGEVRGHQLQPSCEHRLGFQPHRSTGPSRAWLHEVNGRRGRPPAARRGTRRRRLFHGEQLSGDTPKQRRRAARRACAVPCMQCPPYIRSDSHESATKILLQRSPEAWQIQPLPSPEVEINFALSLSLFVTGSMQCVACLQRLLRKTRTTENARLNFTCLSYGSFPDILLPCYVVVVVKTRYKKKKK